MDNRYLYDVNAIPASVSRSSFTLDFKHPFTMKAGDLIPAFCLPVMANSTIKIPNRFVVRSVTPISATMDVLYGEYWYFFVPYRLVWHHFKQFLGENDKTAYTQKTEYTIPQTAWWNGTHTTEEAAKDEIGSIGHHMLGLPVSRVPYLASAVSAGNVDAEDYYVTDLPLRAYAMIYNEWFRNENIQDPILVDYSSDSGTTAIHYFDRPLKVNRLKDWLTTLLPMPQKGDALDLLDPTGEGVPLDTGSFYSFESNSIDEGLVANPGGFKFQSYDNVYPYLDGDSLYASDAPTVDANMIGSNLRVRLSLDAVALRQALAIQSILEIDNRSGTRYKETLFAHWGARLPDSRAMIPEYLGGRRFPIAMQMVAATNQSTVDDETVKLGDIGALSNTDSGLDTPVNFSTPEPGLVIGLFTIRAELSYSQGIDPIWQRKHKLEHFFPELENVGDVKVRKMAAYVAGTADDKETLGFQEAYWELKSKRSYASGYMDPTVEEGLDYLTYGIDFSGSPSLNPDFIQEDSNRVDRTLSASVAGGFQFQVDMYAPAVYTAPMKMYAVPGIKGVL